MQARPTVSHAFGPGVLYLQYAAMMRRHFAADGMPLPLLNAHFTNADVLYLLSTTRVARDQLNKEAISMGITAPTAEKIFAKSDKQ